MEGIPSIPAQKPLYIVRPDLPDTVFMFYRKRTDSLPFRAGACPHRGLISLRADRIILQ